MVWDASMHGVPWTPAKMRRAVKLLREGAEIGFAAGADPLAKLVELDEVVFGQRPDLVLHIWPTGGRSLPPELLDALAGTAALRRLRLSGFSNRSLDPLRGLVTLDELELHGSGLAEVELVAALPRLERLALSGVTDLSPLPRCRRLRALELSGPRATRDLGPLARCGRLRELRLGGARIRSLAPLASLAKLERLSIDASRVEAGGLDPLAGLRRLEELAVTEVGGLQDVDAVGALTGLRSLRLSGLKVTRLPDLSALRRLRSIELQALRRWTNPEVLATAPGLRELELQEIAPALPAERFFFLTDLRRLERVDLRFIDFAKRRRARLDAWFAEAGRSELLVR